MKDRFKIKTIREQILLFVFGVITVCILLAAFIVSRVINNEMGQNYAVDKQAAIASLSQSLPPSLELYDYNQIERIISSSLIYKSVAYIGVQSKEGVLIVSATEQGVSIQSLEIEEQILTGNDGLMVGSFEIGFSRDYIDQQIQTTTGALVLGLMGFLLLMGLALFGLINHQVTSPLAKISSTINKIDSNHLSLRVNIKSHDEIGTLATNFNRMAGDLETAQQSLQKAHDELEGQG